VAIRQSCAEIAPRLAELDERFYQTLFDLAPELRRLFPTNMQQHRSELMRGLLHLLCRVDRPTRLSPILADLGRDQRKFGVTAEHYASVGQALLAALSHAHGSSWTPELDQTWATAYDAVARDMLATAAAERGPALWLGRVVAHHRPGPDLALITVQPLEPIPYRPGQYLSVEIPQRPRLWRYLSPANPPRPDGLMRFHVRAIRGGWVSPALVADTRLDDTWRIGPPLGRLPAALDAGRNLLMIAGGTGTAPINALIAELATRREPPRTHVYIAARTWDELHALTDSSASARHSSWLDITPILQRAVGSDQRGTVADVVLQQGPWTDHDVIVSGSPAMMRATIAQLREAGIPADRIHADPIPTSRPPTP
jgi:NAD(P)H-flavin reductase/hemoglobin-like flavoprotein